MSRCAGARRCAVGVAASVAGRSVSRATATCTAAATRAIAVARTDAADCLLKDRHDPISSSDPRYKTEGSVNADVMGETPRVH